MIFVLFMLLVGKSTVGQTLIFCENVTKDGQPERVSSVFSIGSKGGYFNFLVQLPKPVESELVRYDVFRLDEDKKEAFDETHEQQVDSEALWFWKEIVFFLPGEYNVYVYTAEDRLLCVGQVTVLLDEQ